MSLDSPRPSIEKQQEHFTLLQRTISSELFVSGSVSQLLLHVNIDTNHFSPVDVVDTLWVPGLKRIADRGKHEDELQLVGYPSRGPNERVLPRPLYVPIGRIDEHDMLYAYPRFQLEETALEVLHGAVAMLRQEREIGRLPNLDYSLLHIFNPSTAMTKWVPPHHD